MRTLALFLASTVLMVSAEMVDLGTLAATYEISEPDMLVQVTEQIAALDRQMIVDQYQGMMDDAMSRDSGLPACVQDATYTRPYEVVTKGAYAMSGQPYIRPGATVRKEAKTPVSVCLVDALQFSCQPSRVFALGHTLTIDEFSIAKGGR